MQPGWFWLLGVACNSAPGPTMVAIVPATPVNGDTLRVAIAEGAADPDADPVDYDIVWSLDGAIVDDVGDRVPGDRVEKGQRWQVEVTPSDGRREGPSATADVEIGNTPPTATVALDPPAPRASDEVRCVVTPTDIDDDELTVMHEWVVDGNPAGTAALLEGGQAAPGDVVWCVATVDDGTDARTVQSPHAVMDGSPPSVTVPVLSPNPAFAGDVLTVRAEGADPDGEPVTLRTAWTVRGIPIGEGSTLATDLVSGDLVEVTVTPFDGVLEGEPQSAALTVSNTVPVVTSVELFPAAPLTDDIVVALASAADPDGSTTLAVRWQVDGIVVADGPHLTLDGTNFEKGQVVEAIVTANDGTDVSAAVSASVGVSNTPPTLAAATLSPIDARTADTLTCAPQGFADADADLPDYRFAWTVDGGLIADTTSTLTGTSFAAGQTVGCRITPDDGEALGATVEAPPVVIANTAPTVLDAVVSPAEPTTHTVVTCLPTGGEDADGDEVFFTYAWFVDDVPTGTTGPTLDGALAFDKGQSVSCELVPTDGLAAGTAVRSEPVTVADAAPSAPEAALTPTPSPFDADLTCVVAFAATDPDGDVVDYLVQWSVDGAPYLGPTLDGALLGDTIAAVELAIGETWTCEIVPLAGGQVGPPDLTSTVICDPAASDATACAAPPPPPPTGVTLDPDIVATASVYGDTTSPFNAFSAMLDYNGDGNEDLVVSSSTSSLGVSNGGAIFVFFGPLVGAQSPADADVVITGTTSNSRIRAGARVPDLDGDGDDELLVRSNFPADRGIVLGGTPSGGANAVRAFEMNADQAVALGDTDGDGATNWASVAGRVRLHDGLNATVEAEYVLAGTSGFSSVDLVDIDHDGTEELLLIAPLFTHNQFSRAGAVFVVEPPFTGGVTLDSPDATVHGEATWTYLGSGLGIGDLDNDGFLDILAGGPFFEQLHIDEGALFGFFGPFSGSPRTHHEADVRILGEQEDLQLGGIPPLVRDFDGDGIVDLAVGTGRFDRPGLEAAGAVWLLRGPTVGSRTLDEALESGVFIPGTTLGDVLGTLVAWSDDLDGDGGLDLVIAAPGQDTAAGNAANGVIHVLPGPF